MNVLFVALGVYSREGGIERFNRRVLGCLSAGVAAGTIDRARAVALWDTDAHAASAPEGAALFPGREKKARALRAFVRAVRAERPDVILYGHALLVPLALVARLLHRRARNVLIAHGYEVWDPPSRPRRWATRKGIDRVASVSDYTAARMAKAYGMQPARFARVINATDLVASPPPPRDGTGAKLLAVSRLNPLDKAKHVDRVIRAMPAVLAGRPDAELFVAGDGEWRAELEALARSLGVAERVHLLGTVSDEERENLYATSDVFVLPSTQEGFGIVYLEAWRHRLPVVAGAGGAAPEVVRDGEEGLVVAPDPSAIAEAVLRLLDDPALARRLGDAGHARLTEAFTPEHFDRAFLEMLDAVRAR